ncbi:DUF4349 domain-containing protein [Candidatus Falkowbacteria bacterium]|nr:DUF4349 domain-containing protein [Candidatus Falkowbacteria bacterium]
MDNAPKINLVKIIKKIVLIILVIIGVLAVIYFLLHAVISWRNRNSYYSIESPVALPSSGIDFGIGMTALDVRTKESTQSYEMAAPIPAMAPSAGNAGMTEQKIIKTANLAITVDDVEKTAAQITNDAILLNGFVQNSTITEDRKGQKFANLILRVPVSGFDNLISKIKSLAKLVERENISGKEVTEEYVDLQADLSHNLAVEAQYLELLKRAQKVEEIIAVREKLDQVQGEIERIKGRVRYLDNQTEMSTIAVSISSEAQINIPAEKWQPYVILKQAIQNLIVSLQGFVNFIIVAFFWLISIIPYLLVLGLIYIIARWIYKRVRKPKI